MSITSRIALTVALAGSASLALAGTPAFASSPLTSTSVTTSYTCTAVTPKGTYSYSGTAAFTGTTPASVAVGASVVVSGFQASVTIPGSVLDEVYSDGLRSITAGVSAFDINATDANMPTVNIVKKLLKVGHLTLLPSGNPSLNVNIPRKAATGVGGWVASTAGTMTFTPGNATFQFKTHAGSLSVQCAPSSPAPISTTTVS
jgi:hypothetical protein